MTLNMTFHAMFQVFVFLYFLFYWKIVPSCVTSCFSVPLVCVSSSFRCFPSLTCPFPTSVHLFLIPSLVCVYSLCSPSCHVLCFPPAPSPVSSPCFLVCFCILFFVVFTDLYISFVCTLFWPFLLLLCFLSLWLILVWLDFSFFCIIQLCLIKAHLCSPYPASCVLSAFWFSPCVSP